MIRLFCFTVSLNCFFWAFVTHCITIADKPEPTPPEPTPEDNPFFTGDFNGGGKAMLARQKDSAVTIYADGAEWGNGLARDPGWQIEGAMQETPVGFLGGEDLLEKG